MVKAATVCLVTSTHVSANPRLVKEADALAEAGYTVHVVAADVNDRLRTLDQPILARAAWTFSLVQRPSFTTYATLTLLQRASRLLLTITRFRTLLISRLAHHRLTARLARAARRIRANLYLGHNLAALPAVAFAAKKNETAYAFDCEDFHTEELTLQQRERGDQLARETLEQTLLPGCSYVTAASPLIAAAYQDKYNIKVTPILNVFPLLEAPQRPATSEEVVPRSLYWFSQTIGTGRGIEEIIAAIALMHPPPKLFLRGNPAAGYAEAIADVARPGKVDVQLLDSAPAGEMAELAQRYAIGLAIEPASSLNNSLALSNKIFTYLLAGLPVLLSRTRAQEQLALELGDAVLLVDVHDAQAVATVLTSFFADPVRQQKARDAAWATARDKFNWDIEKKKFVALVEAVTPTDAPSLVRRPPG